MTSSPSSCTTPSVSSFAAGWDEGAPAPGIERVVFTTAEYANGSPHSVIVGEQSHERWPHSTRSSRAGRARAAANAGPTASTEAPTRTAAPRPAMTQGPLPAPGSHGPTRHQPGGAPIAAGLRRDLRQMWVTLRRSSVVADGAMRSRSVHKLELRLTGPGACPPNRSGDRWQPNHGAELVSRIRDGEWLAWHFES
jgi:hypothetical protein